MKYQPHRNKNSYQFWAAFWVVMMLTMFGAPLLSFIAQLFGGL